MVSKSRFSQKDPRHVVVAEGFFHFSLPPQKKQLKKKRCPDPTTM
jgi:hypothetical protein